jgi:small subunit ribosomal protein S20
MPHHKSMFKRLRRSKAQKLYNRAVRTEVRQAVKSARTVEKKEVGTELVSAYSVLDRAAKKGVYKARTVARLKSRLAKHANRVAG